MIVLVFMNNTSDQRSLLEWGYQYGGVGQRLLQAKKEEQPASHNREQSPLASDDWTADWTASEWCKISSSASACSKLTDIVLTPTRGK